MDTEAGKNQEGAGRGIGGGNRGLRAGPWIWILLAAAIVGVLVEVPVMLSVVKIANRTARWFPPEKREGRDLL